MEEQQNRIKAEEEAAAAALALTSARAPPNSPTIPPAIAEAPDASSQGPKGPGLTARRQSTISLSSLHRPVFPHKLDLSAAALRLNPEELGFQSGLASPVMLAPKSSISRVPPDFPFGSAADVDIDLTLDDDIAANITAPSSTVDIAPTLGNSADKAIELLDLDMELFGEAVGAQHSTPTTEARADGAQPVPLVKQETIDFGLFDFQAPDVPSEAGKDGGPLASVHADSIQNGSTESDTTHQ